MKHVFAIASALMCLAPTAALGSEDRSDPLIFSFSVGSGQINSQVARSVAETLHFNFSAIMFETAIGPAHLERVNLDYFKATFFSPNRLQGSFNWFGLSSVDRHGDIDGFSANRLFPGGIEFLPLNTQFHAQATRGYVIYRPTLALQQHFYALRIAPMGGRGYGQLPSGGRSIVGFAGFNVGLDGKFSSGWLTGSSKVRIQAGMSIDLYEDLTGHLGQISTSGVINNDTMAGLAYCELVFRPAKSDEWALGWKASYDRFTPYDPASGIAARNEDTAIALYLRWSGGANVGSPVAGSTF